LKILVNGKTLLTVLVLSATIGMMFNGQGDQAFAKSHHSSSSSTSSAGSATTGATNSTSSQGIGNVPVETNQFSHGLDFSNVIVYLNSSDGHYHLKGLAKNTLPETRSNSIYLTIDFQDKSTGTTIKSLSGNINAPIDPGQTAPFDVDTGYTSAQGNQLQFVKVEITY
jgi:hypothetical protein